MSEIDKLSYEQIKEAVKRFCRNDAAANNLVVYIKSLLAQHREAVEREARIDELKRLYALKVNEIHNEINQRIKELKQQPELQEESDEHI